ncbi:MAG: LacI family transcriptional regulator [Spirochaetae bacterium HGW-Spirochaetae-8]|jgi:LacI family transcriptional regulator|nr:MAG: LacI family transcriptional regulator [Spirochaetae bacterium HGW-Spirochaetae-8]
MENQKITIDDIARQIGVSKTTVSRVLNNKPYVDAVTKKKILDLIEETGFTPQKSAINLSVGRTNIIGLLVPSLSNPYSLTVIQGVAEKIAQGNYELMLYTTGLSEVNQKRFLQKISTKNVDGLVVVLPRDSGDLEKQLGSSNLPIVLIDHRGIDTHLHSISVTNEKGGFDATEHLVGLGHERIGFITGVLDFGCSRDRLEGYKVSLALHGIAFREELISEGDFTETSGYEATRRLLNLVDRPTAIFCSNDDMAIGAMRAAQEIGLRIPNDLSLVGFDDTVRASMVYPPLTTIKQPLFKMGEMAAVLVKRLIDGETVESVNIVLNTELIVRGSCAKRQ